MKCLKVRMAPNMIPGKRGRATILGSGMIDRGSGMIPVLQGILGGPESVGNRHCFCKDSVGLLAPKPVQSIS